MGFGSFGSLFFGKANLTRQLDERCPTLAKSAEVLELYPLLRLCLSNLRIEISPIPAAESFLPWLPLQPERARSLEKRGRPVSTVKFACQSGYYSDPIVFPIISDDNREQPPANCLLVSWFLN